MVADDGGEVDDGDADRETLDEGDGDDGARRALSSHEHFVIEHEQVLSGVVDML